MARIRSLKPEHKQHRKIGPLSDRQYRLWVSLVTESDDEGRFIAEAEQLRILTWGFHPDVTVEDCEAALQHLATVKLIRLYHKGGVRYGVFPSWLDHQRINRPTPSRLPPSPTPHRVRREPSVSTPRELSEDSQRIGGDRKGKDRSGSEGRGHGEGPDVACATGSDRTPQMTAAQQLAALAQRNGLTPEELHDQATAIAKASVRR